jgi:hypothetical protein
LWRERYHAREGENAEGKGPKGYCEYAAVLIRLALQAK